MDGWQLKFSVHPACIHTYTELLNNGKIVFIMQYIKNMTSFVIINRKCSAINGMYNHCYSLECLFVANGGSRP